MSEESFEELQSSELGTQEYWDEAYSLEMKNFEEHGDVGEVWFGEDSALRIVSWLTTSPLVNHEDRIIDLGCGNGMLLVELAREGFSNLVGVDYSEKAVELAKSVARSQNLTIRYEVYDLLGIQNSLSSQEFTIALDKGTYDAISLHPDEPKHKREQYISNVCNLLKPQGLLVITSCNWTEKELVSHFSTKFCLLNVIPTPTFRFGGKVGNLITSVILQKTS